MGFWRSSKARSVNSSQQPAQIRLAGLDQPVKVRRSPRARRLSLRVNEVKRAAVLTLPPRVSYAEAGDFLARHFEWLHEKMAALPNPIPFVEGAELPLRGQDHRLAVSLHASGRNKVWSAAPDGAAEEGSVPFLFVQGPEHRVAPRLLAWLKTQARGDISNRVALHADRLAVRPKRISIRDQATRWGSCSADGALSFSWRLILTPPFVLDYVAAHEVAHMLELNHGPRFWSLVKDAAPRLDEARVWLKANGPRLHQYGAGP